MQDPIGHPKPASRDRRAALAPRLLVSSQSCRDAERKRRGTLTALPESWRRTEMGTNHIACFGVWRQGTRRQAERCNRSGTTRWHMPHRGGSPAVVIGAWHEAVNED